MTTTTGQQQQQQPQQPPGIIKDGRFYVDKKVEFVFRALVSQIASRAQPQSQTSQQHADFAAALEDFENYCDQVYLFCANQKQSLALQEAMALETSEQQSINPQTGHKHSIQTEESEAIRDLEKTLLELCRQSSSTVV